MVPQNYQKLDNEEHIALMEKNKDSRGVRNHTLLFM
jgi:hypothetical protein